MFTVPLKMEQGNKTMNISYHPSLCHGSKSAFFKGMEK